MLCEHFEEIANNTWINLKDAKRLGIFYGEETITNNILLYLARLNLPSIKIICNYSDPLTKGSLGTENPARR